VIEDMLRRDKGFPRSAGWASLLALCLSLGAEGTAKAKAEKPAYVWLWYADGTPMPMDGLNCLGFKPPAFTCSYGATVEDCQRQVQTYLDTWYADFNIVFTLTRPANGEIFYPMVISADGSWCLQTQTEAGVAPNNNCIDTHALAAIAFECGKSAHACATIIAHEHGHLVGLEHTVSKTDVMNPIIQATAVGFDNKINSVPSDADLCNHTTQNSYQTMLKALGAWPSGTSKPTLFSSVVDAGADTRTPDLAPANIADAPLSGSVVGITTPEIDGGSGIVVLSGFDAIARPSLPTVDASGAKTSTANGGCSMTPALPNASTSALLLGLAALLARRSALRWSASRSRRAATRRPQPRHFLA
jgi:hypothetical protein